MTREALFKKYYKNPKHDYEMAETLEACPDGDIFFIYSGRNRAKSFEISSQMLADAWYDGKQMAYVRRHVATIGDVEQYFEDKHDFIKDMTDNEATGITMSKGTIYFYKDVLNEKTGSMRKVLGKELGNFFAVSKQGSYKSLQYPKIWNMLYEEVLTDDPYLSAEPEKLMNLISTVGRHRKYFRTWLISNTVSIVNPYSRSWGINLSKNKPGDISIVKLYLQSYDDKGEEEYYKIATHFLPNKDDITKEDLKKKRNRVRTGITSNKWDELHLYTTIDLSFFRKWKPIDTAIFEYDDIMIQCNITEVPINILDYYMQDEDDEYNKVELSDVLMPVLYFRRKTGDIKPGTRVYTNNPERFSPYVTQGFKQFYKIDNIIRSIYDRGWIIGADNLTMNDFRNIFSKLRLKNV